MDLLQNKLERLSPDQRREVEDFVDFLLFRSDNRPAPVPAGTVPPVLSVTPSPPELLQVPPVQESSPSPRIPPGSPASPVSALPEGTEPLHEILPGEDGLTRDYMDYGGFEEQRTPATEAVKKVKRKIIQRDEEAKPRQILDWID